MLYKRHKNVHLTPLQGEVGVSVSISQSTPQAVRGYHAACCLRAYLEGWNNNKI